MPDPAQSKILRVGLLSEVRSLDPRSAYEVESTFVLRQVVEGPFTEVYGTTEVEPSLFRSALRPRASGEVFEAELRDDVVFSDGSPLRVGEVARLLQESAQISGQADVAAEGDRLVFRLTRPNARFELVLSHLQCGIYRASDKRLMGTGPFQLTPESTSTFIRLVRNPRYREPVALDEVHFKTYPPDQDGRATALLKAIEEGEVDLSLSLGREGVEAARNVRKSILPGVSVGMLFLNCDSPRLRDRNLRAAIAHSIDRLQVTKTSYANALAFAAASVTPRPLGPADDRLTFNPELAKSLLAQVGSKPEKLTMLTVWGPRPYLPYPQRAAQVIAEQIAHLGIQVEIVPAASGADHLRRTHAGAFDLSLAGWVADTMDPCDFLDCCLSSERIPSAGNEARESVACNHGHLRSAEMDEALDRFRGDRQSENLQAIIDIVEREVPLVPLMYGSSTCVHGFNVRNVKPTPLWHVPMHKLDIGL